MASRGTGKRVFRGRFVRDAAQKSVDVPRRFLAMADRDGDGALGAGHIASRENARPAGHHVRPDFHDAIFDNNAGRAAQQ